MVATGQVGPANAGYVRTMDKARALTRFPVALIEPDTCTFSVRSTRWFRKQAAPLPRSLLHVWRVRRAWV